MNLPQELDTHLQQTLSRLPGHGLTWLNEYRQQTLADFMRTDLGGKQDKQWQISATCPGFQAGASADISLEWLQRYRLAEAYGLVFVDGILRPEYARREGLPEGVVLKGLSEMTDAELTAIRSRLTPQPAVDDALGRWNLIWMQDGVYLHIPERVRLEKPVQILCFGGSNGVNTSLRHLMTLGQQAEAIVMETCTSPDEVAGFTLTSTDIRLETGAVLEHYSLQVESARVRHFCSIQVDNGVNTHFRQHHVALGGSRSLVALGNRIDQAAECQMNGLFYAHGNRHTEIHTRVNHVAALGHSRQNYRGLATDKATGVFDGIIQVQKEAAKISATLQNRNLLLSPSAEIDSRPQLEINADDVQCSHGVTVGQLDDDAVFFLMARGLDEAEARTILSFAFANAIIQNMPSDSYRSLVQTAFLSALPHADIHQDWL